MDIEKLSERELDVIKYVDDYANQFSKGAYLSIQMLLKKNSISGMDPKDINKKILSKKLTINYHPDLINNNKDTVVKSILDSGRYYNQYITNLSNGHLSVKNDKQREIWEKKIFGPGLSMKTSERPKYGALNIFNYIDGASPKYGSCYFELNSLILERCTFLIADSNNEMKIKGTKNNFDLLLLTMMIEIIKTGKLFGKEFKSLNAFLDFLLYGTENKYEMGKNILDYGLEAQIFGVIDLSRDVEYVYIDESYRGTCLHYYFEKLSIKYNIGIRWIPERKLLLSELFLNYKNNQSQLIDVVKQIIFGEYINANMLGQIRSIVTMNFEVYCKYGSLAEWNHLFNYIWKCIVDESPMAF